MFICGVREANLLTHYGETIIRLRAAHWCSWLTRCPLKAEITGSSPVCATKSQVGSFRTFQLRIKKGYSQFPFLLIVLLDQIHRFALAGTERDAHGVWGQLLDGVSVVWRQGLLTKAPQDQEIFTRCAAYEKGSLLVCPSVGPLKSRTRRWIGRNQHNHNAAQLCSS